MPALNCYRHLGRSGRQSHHVTVTLVFSALCNTVMSFPKAVFLVRMQCWQFEFCKFIIGPQQSQPQALRFALNHPIPNVLTLFCRGRPFKGTGSRYEYFFWRPMNIGQNLPYMCLWCTILRRPKETKSSFFFLRQHEFLKIVIIITIKFNNLIRVDSCSKPECKN